MWNLILALTLQAWALNDTNSAIEQAQALAIKKNRKEACAVLERAIPAASAKSQPKLLEALNQISEMFFTDKGQKAFEAGQSALWDNPEMALTQLRSALALEDGNVRILSAIARGQLIKQECDAAHATLQEARAINPHAVEPALLELRSLICLQRFEAFPEKMKSLPTIADKWHGAYASHLSAQVAYQQKAWRKANDAFVKISEEHPAFPDAYYWAAKSGAELDKDGEAQLQKYVSLCKALTARERKRFSLEPVPCANLKDAEDELAKKSIEP